MIIYRIYRLSDDFVSYFEDEPRERMWRIAETAPLAHKWVPIKVTVCTRGYDNDERELPWPNMGSLCPYAPVLDEKAVKALKRLLGKVELLPVDVCGAIHRLVHFLDHPPCLDVEASKVTRNPVTQHVSDVDKYVFRPSCVAGRHLFLVPEMRALELYASDEFKRQVEAAGLTGFGFKEIWRSDY